MSDYLDIQLTLSGKKVDMSKTPNFVSIPGVLTLALLCINF